MTLSAWKLVHPGGAVALGRTRLEQFRLRREVLVTARRSTRVAWPLGKELRLKRGGARSSRASSRENRGWPGPEGLIIPGCHYKSVESFWTIPHGWSLTNLQGDRERLKVVLKDVSVLAVPGSTCITQSLGCRGGSNRTETPPANSMSYV